MTFPPLSTSSRTELITAPAIRFLYVILLIGLTKLIVDAMPFEAGDPGWRYFTESHFLGAAPEFGFMLLVIIITANARTYYTTMRVAGVLAGLLAAACTATILLYGLDFLTLRHVQPQPALAAFMREGVRVVLTSVLLVLALLLLSIRAFAASGHGPEEEVRRQLGHGLVVGQPD